MAAPKKSEKVPKNMQAKYDAIVSITDAFAAEHLNDEYAQLIRHAAAALARKRPSPISRGQAKSWACGITHAIGMVNFLYDPSQDPHMKASELYKAFGVGASTGQGKSKQVRDILDTGQMDPDWSLSSMLQRNPLATMVMVDGMPVDARMLPRQMQEMLFEAGAIAVIPDESRELDEQDFAPDKADIEPDNPSTLKRDRRPPVEAGAEDVFRFEIFIFDGPVTQKFIEKNPVICREIEILGKQTLADFHRIIFQAFNREEEHMYEFQVRGSAPNAPDAERHR